MYRWNVKKFAGSLCLFFVLATASWATSLGKITIDKCGDKRGVVQFDHAIHVSVTPKCSTCHHTQDDLTAETGEAQACRSCHFKPEDESIPGCNDASTPKNAYHKQCIDCHKAIKMEDESIVAPTSCKACHS